MTQAREDRPAAVDPAPPRSPESLAELTDLCVKCGLCLPHCPTYGLNRREGDSPRGRIALIQGLATAQLTPSPELEGHLAGCLTCRSCETVCPAKVPYGQIIDRGRAELARHARESTPSAGAVGPAPGTRWFMLLARHPGLSRLVPALLRLARVTGIPALARRWMPDHWFTRSVGIRTAGVRAPAAGSVHKPPASHPQGTKPGPGQGAVPGEVALFTGCMARGLDGATLRDGVRVLNALGLRVNVPKAQGCCGALAQHDGRAAEARSARTRNVSAFRGNGAPIVTFATGCAITLAEYGEGHADGDDAIPDRVTDISRFLLANPDALDRLDLRGPGQPRRVALHVPCSARLLPGAGDDARALLERIPGLELVRLRSAGCCGAAGHQFLTRPRQADALRAPLLEQVRTIAPDFLATSNPGCALHLAGGSPDLAVLHPVSLLARALDGDW